MARVTATTATTTTTPTATEDELYEYINTLEDTLSATQRENAAMKRSIAAFKANSTRRRTTTHTTNVA